MGKDRIAPPIKKSLGYIKTGLTMCSGSWGMNRNGSGMIERCWGTSRIRKERGALKRGGLSGASFYPTWQAIQMA